MKVPRRLRKMSRKLPAKFLTWTDYYKFLDTEFPKMENYTGLTIVRFIASDNCYYNFNVNELKKRSRQETKKYCRRMILRHKFNRLKNMPIIDRILFILRIIVFGTIIYLIIKYL